MAQTTGLPTPIGDDSPDGPAQFLALATAIRALVGSPLVWLLDTIPDGYLEFNGQAINAQQYPVLAGLFGANLPDLRGLVMVGHGTVPNDPLARTLTVGANIGEGSHLLTAAESGRPAGSTTATPTGDDSPNHGHNVQLNYGWVGLTTGQSGTWGVIGMGTSGIQSDATPTRHQHPIPVLTVPAVNAGSAHNNLQPGRPVKWITIAA